MIVKRYCPECHGSSLDYHPRSQTACCSNCQFTSHIGQFPDFKPAGKAKAKRKAQGSGVVAGRIKIPTYRWGGTRLG